MVNLQKLKEIKELRKVWPNEATDFTPWLSKDENIELLSDAIGIDITVDETESPVGDFSVDIFASETGTDRKVIIENQLEDTNHDHLGKLITYAAGKSAVVIIWVVKHAREEHKAAIEWLNNHTDEQIGFFLCEIKLYQIGNSDPAVKFEIIEKPNEWAKEIKKNDSNTATEIQRVEYWTEFKNYASNNKQFSSVFKFRKPSTNHWYDFAIGSSDCHLSILQVRKNNEINVEVYIDEDKDLFHQLHNNKDEIERNTNLKFDWMELPTKKASRILVKRNTDFSDKNNWAADFEWIMDVMLKVKKEFKKYL